MELGGGCISNLKANNFLGFIDLKYGIVIISLTQLLFGVGLYCTLHYLHPSLIGVAWFLLLLHFITGSIGLVSTLTRNFVLYLMYLILFVFSLVVVSMVALDMAELVHFFPKAPEIHNLSLLGLTGPFVTKFKMPNSSVLFPFNFFKLPNDTTGVLPQLPHPDALVVTKFTMTNIDPHNHKHCNTKFNNVGLSQRLGNEKLDERFDDDLSDVLGNLDGSDELNNLRNALKQRIDNNTVDNTGSNSKSSTGNYNAYDNPDGKVNTNSDNTVNSTDNTNSSTNSSVNSSNNSTNSVKNKNDNFYDHLPFMPHPGETEGESEEVSKDEFPPETNDLTPEGKSEVVVLYKLQKRSFKFAASAVITLFVMFYLYSFWVALSFGIGKCSPMHEFSSKPDQFPPLID